MKNKVIRGLLLSVAALAVGYCAIAFPFRLFDTMSRPAMQAVFLGELVLYFVIGMLFLVASERKKAQKEKAAQRHLARERKIQRVYENWYDVAA